MNEQFKTAYKALSINEKRNALSNELLVIGNLIMNVQERYGIMNPCVIKNYDITADSKKNESEMLDFFYEDVYNIEKEFITLISLIEQKERE